MDVQVSKSDKCRQHIEIKLSAAEYAPYVDKTLNAVKKNARVSGFRPGKAPAAIVKKMYSEAIEKKTLEDLIPNLLDEVSKQHNLHILEIANDSEIKHAHGGLEMRFTVEVAPEVTIQNYSDFEIEQIEYVISDQDVAEAIENLREQQGWLEPVESGAAGGHIVVADVQQVDQNGVPLIGHKYDDREIIVSEQAETPEDFTPQLLGVKAGDSRMVRATRSGQDGQSRDIFFRIAVKDVSERKIPELDDELARDIGELNSLEELRTAVRHDLERQARNRSRDEVEREIVKEIILRNPFEVPESVVERYTETYRKNLVKSYPQAAKSDELEQAARSQAMRDVRWHYLMDAICEAEKLEVNDAEIRDYITAVEEAGKGDAQRQINRIMHNDKERERVRNFLLEHKLLNQLQGKIRINTRKQAFSDTYQSRIVTA